MVERFNRRLGQVLHSHHFNSAEELQKTLLQLVWLYNHNVPQKALGHEAPAQTVKKLEDESAYVIRKERVQSSGIRHRGSAHYMN